MRWMQTATGSGTGSLVVAAAALAAACPAQAAVRYVNVNLVTGADNGSSWADAYRTPDGVSRALAAAGSGDEVWVGAGTYRPTAGADRAAAVALRSGVAVYGGFTGVETARLQRDPAAHPTVLSGDLAGNDPAVVSDNSYHVVSGNGADATAVLDGFTITAGNASGASASDQDRGGGMIFLSGSGATVRGCRIVGNRVAFGGGGTYIRQSSPTFVDCAWQGNQGASFGGGIDMATNCNPSFTRCAFIGNSANRAGGVEVFGNSLPVFVNCIFRDNAAGSAGGGGLYVGSASTPTLRHCTIARNTATGSGSGLLATSNSTPRVFNSIVYGNTGPGGATAGQLSASSAFVTYSCVQGGFAGAGNIDADPRFVSAASGDLRLLAGSPCIDAARNPDSGTGNTVDLAGGARFVDDPATVDAGVGPGPVGDMGAYEFVPAPACAPLGSACPADFDCSGEVNANDISAYLNGWYGDLVGGTVAADFDGSGETNANDIPAFINGWYGTVVNGGAC